MSHSVGIVFSLFIGYSTSSIVIMFYVDKICFLVQKSVMTLIGELRHCVGTLTGHGTVLAFHKSRHCIGTVTSHGTVLALSQVTALYWHSYKPQYSQND